MDVVEALDEVVWKDVPCPSSFALNDTMALQRFNLSPDGRMVTFMSRPKTLRRVLLDKLLGNHPRTIYLDGGQGVGKSHLLLELILELRALGYRVVYLPDCKVLADVKRSGEEAEVVLREYILDALTTAGIDDAAIQAASTASPFFVKHLFKAVVG
jgi:chromosomal replication initiation ATPase DnaA